MPVIREQQRVGPVQPGGVVPASGTRAWGQVVADAGRVAFEASRGVARVLADEDTDSAIALAEQTMITVDENGVPQADTSSVDRERMSKNARKAYDKTLRPRLEQRYQVALEARLQELSIEYDGQPEQFAQAAQAAVEGMSEHVPDNMRAFWNDAAVTGMSKHGATMGRQAYEDAQKAKASDYQVMIDRSMETIRDAILSGNPDAADEAIIMLDVMGDDLVRQGALQSYQVADALRDAHAARGAAQIQHTANEQHWTSDQYEAAATALLQGGTALDDLFPDETSRRAAYGTLTNLASRKRSEESAIKKAQDERNEEVRVLKGTAEVNDNSRKALDRAMGTKMEDWGRSPIAHAPETWEQIRNAGFLSDSLLGAFRAASRPGNMDPAEREQIFRIVRELQNGRAPDGTRTNLGWDIPPELSERFMITAAFMEFGGDTFETADLHAQELQQRGFNNVQLVNAMSSAGTPIGGGEWDEKEIRTQMDRWVDTWLEDELGSVIPDEDSRMAATWFAKVVSTDAISPDDALAMVRKQMENRYIETDYIYDPILGSLNRSWAAPEAVYRVPTDPSPGVIGRLEAGFAAGPGGLLMGYSAEEVRERTTPWFERYADGLIRKNLTDEQAQTLGLRKSFLGIPYGNQLLTPGEDYKLEPVGGDRLRPQYRVYAANDNGTWSLLPMTLDPAGAHAAEVDRLNERDGDDYYETQRKKVEKLKSFKAEVGRLPVEEQKRFERYAQERGASGTSSKIPLFRDFQKENGR